MSKTRDRKINILLVDDNSANLLALAAILDHPRYNLVMAGSGKEALEQVRLREFAVVLLDVQMPEMDGFEVARRMRANASGRNIPIIFVTAIYREAKFVHDGYAAGGVDYLFKPLDAAITKSKVAVFVDLFEKNKSLRALQDRTARLVAVQRITTDVLADSSDVPSAIPRILMEICKTLQWDMGTFWDVDDQKNTLKCQHYWSDPSCPAAFISDTVKEKFLPGIGLPGRVWLGSKALWGDEGMGSAFAFPIEVDGKTRGVMEFFCRIPQFEDPDLLKIMTAVGSQIGQFIAKVESLQIAQESICARDEFLSIASHELRTPLTVLRLQTQFNRRRIDKSEQKTLGREDIDKFLKITVNQVERMIHLVESMLDVARIANGKLSIDRESSDLSEIVKLVLDGYSDPTDPSKLSRFSINLAEGVIGNWDRVRIEQIVNNLISNALKYGGDGEIQVEVTGNENMARVSVTDSGPGIAPGDLERIFKRFERASRSTNISGLGLGLYISREIAQAHGGDLKATSEIGKGSTFTIELPRRQHGLAFDAMILDPRTPDDGEMTFYEGKKD